MRSAWSDITKPGVQKPHWLPWQSTIACCTGLSAPSGAASASTVTTWHRSTEGRRRMQAFTGS